MFQKAERKKAKLRLGLVGSAGSGKTLSALLIASGLGGKIAMIDTEHRSGELYADTCDYDVCQIEAPYTVQKYLAAISEAEKAGYDVIIIDSLSHAWAGDGGLLDQQGKIAASGKGNSYTAWRDVTPWHNKLIDAMLTSRCHIIATMRAKTEYVLQDNGKGKVEPKKIGMAPVQRDGMDYEFTVCFDLDQNHNATASKDRTGLFDGVIVRPSKETGESLLVWLDSGKEEKKPSNTPAKQSNQQADTPTNPNAERLNAIWHGYMEVCENKPHAVNAIKQVVGDRKKEEWTADDLSALEADIERRRADAEETPMPGVEEPAA